MNNDFVFNIKKAVTNINLTDDVTLITLNNVPNNIKTIANIFTAIADNNINIDMISQTTPYKETINISFTLSDIDVSKTINVLGKFKKLIPKLRVEINSNNYKVSIFGEGMKDTPGVAAKLFEILSKNNITIKLITTSEVDVSYLICKENAKKLVQCLKNEFDIK